MDANVKASPSNCLFLLNNLHVGGSEKKTVNLVNHLAERDRSIHLLYLNDPDVLRPLVSQQVQCGCVGRRGKLDLRAVQYLRGYITQHDIDTVLSVNLYPMLYAVLARLFLKRTVRLLVGINTTTMPNMYERLQLLLYVPLLWRMDLVIFGNEQQRAFWSRRYGIGKRKSCVVYNGVDEERFNPDQVTRKGGLRESYGIQDGQIVLGMVAAFRPEKSHADLVEAVKTLVLQGYDVVGMFAGDGPEMGKIRRLVDEWNLQRRIIFLGEQEDVRSALSAMDVFVLTSRSVETFSNAALEAMAMGKPVILSNLMGASEMVEDGVNGYLYPPGDVNALVESIKALVDGAKMREMGETSRRIVENRFSREQMVIRYEDIIWGASPVDQGTWGRRCVQR